MKPDPKAEGLRWLRQAERDLDDAEYSLAGRRYNLACFLRQQTAEKALKAILYAKGAEQVHIPTAFPEASRRRPSTRRTRAALSRSPGRSFVS